ncbi:hypothetical protein A4U61_21510 [Streptomyces sp. H-KF8]|nr:hypothetical protein A4U61_21510 [Streptomyces sp. H-KF8]
MSPRPTGSPTAAPLTTAPPTAAPLTRAPLIPEPFASEPFTVGPFAPGAVLTAGSSPTRPPYASATPYGERS